MEGILARPLSGVKLFEDFLGWKFYESKGKLLTDVKSDVVLHKQENSSRTVVKGSNRNQKQFYSLITVGTKRLEESFLLSDKGKWVPCSITQAFK